VLAQPELELQTVVNDRQGHGRSLATDSRWRFPALRIGLGYHSIYQYVDVDYDRDAAWRHHAQKRGLFVFRLRPALTASRRWRGPVIPAAVALLSPISRTRSSGILSHTCYTGRMAKVITQRTLRNESGEIMRGLDRGESYIVTRNGVPVGELMPVRRREAVPAEMLLAALAGAPRIDPIRFRKDVDDLIDQDPRPRA